MRKTLWVIMLIRAHFLLWLLQNEAYTCGLIFLLGAKQSNKGMEGSQCLRLCVCICVCGRVRAPTCIYPSISVSVCQHFLSGSIQVPPDAAAICSPANQRLHQNASPSEPCFTGLPVCQYNSH